MNETENDKEICTISIGTGGLDDDYTFFESGKVRRVYDRHIWKGGLNREEILGAKDIDEASRDKLLQRCPEEHIEKIRRLLKV